MKRLVIIHKIRELFTLHDSDSLISLVFFNAVVVVEIGTRRFHQSRQFR